VSFKRILQTAVGIGLSGAGLWLFLRGSDLHRLGAELAATQPAIILAATALALGTLYLRAFRWRLILPAVSGTHTKNLASHTIIGFMVNNIVPARVGEAVRAVLLWRRNGFSPSVSIGSLVLERAIDTHFFMLFFLLPALQLPVLHQLAPIGWLLAAAWVGGLIALVVCSMHPIIIAKCVAACRMFLPKRFGSQLDKIGKDLASNLAWTHSWRRVLGVVSLSMIIPLCYTLMIILLVGDTATFGLLQGCFMVAGAALGAAIPLSPGYVGTMHATILEGFDLLGMNPERGRALAVLFHAIGYVPTVLLGLIYFFKSQISLKEISGAQKALEE
jgi:glycosyltransferase 2 family protein